MCLNWLRYKLCKQKNISPPNYLEDISNSEVLTILKAEFPEAVILLTDDQYKTTSKDELLRFLREDATDKYSYVPEFYDCDNFSFRLIGQISNPSWGMIPFGFTFINGGGVNHALNCFIDIERELWLVEPQDDRMFKCPNKWKGVIVIL